jgi:hypothetical protein
MECPAPHTHIKQISPEKGPAFPLVFRLCTVRWAFQPWLALCSTPQPAGRRLEAPPSPSTVSPRQGPGEAKGLCWSRHTGACGRGSPGVAMLGFADPEPVAPSSLAEAALQTVRPGLDCDIFWHAASAAWVSAASLSVCHGWFLPRRCMSKTFLETSGSTSWTRLLPREKRQHWKSVPFRGWCRS